MRTENVTTKLCPNCGAPMIGSGKCSSCDTETTFHVEGKEPEAGLIDELYNKFPGLQNVTKTFGIQMRIIGDSLDDYTVHVEGINFQNLSYSGYIRKETFEINPTDAIFVLMKSGGRNATINAEQLSDLSQSLIDHAQQRSGDAIEMQDQLTKPSLYQKFKQVVSLLMGKR